jgi:hypothetical protein
MTHTVPYFSNIIFGPIPHPNYIFNLSFTSIKAFIPVSVFVITKALSLQLHDNIIG